MSKRRRTKSRRTKSRRTKSRRTKPRRTRSRSRIIRVLRQHGTSDKQRDEKREAQLPGVRISRFGRRYTETRRNRSDEEGSRL